MCRFLSESLRDPTDREIRGSAGRARRVLCVGGEVRRTLRRTVQLQPEFAVAVDVEGKPPRVGLLSL